MSARGSHSAIEGKNSSSTRKTIYAGMGQFMVIQVVFLLLLLFFPAIALWLPRALN